MDIEERIMKDVDKFDLSYRELINIVKDIKVLRALELAKMYRNDSIYYINKKDYYTAFSCISYAHGILDAVRKIFYEE
ncbi:MAG: hypothetical protein ARM1_0345 [Candidatus Micrarchaeota archaeon]|nr:MAG: hypothetical protein ARM1_0345 [Candidatus Micrarchaeota archaeon]